MSQAPLVSTVWLAKQVARGADTVILDATVLLEPPRYNGDYRVHSGIDGWQHAHIPGSVFADLLGPLSNPYAAYHFAVPRTDVLVAELERLGVGDDRSVVIYDRDNGFWAARLWWVLRAVGVQASVLDGGFKLWLKQGLPAARGSEVRPAPGKLTWREVPGSWVSIEAVEDIIAGRAPGTLVCALSRDVFAGRALTRYARAGHLPGSLNIPAHDLLDAEGRYRARQELRRILIEPLESAPRPWVLYCGGGISASVNALGLALLGETQVGIYDGSLEEWAANPALPLALGD